MAIETFPKGYGARKRRSQKTAFGIFRGLSLFIVLVLFAILGFIIYRGAGVIDWTFLTEAPSDGMTSGGIFPAIIGTLLLMAGSAIVAFPVGIMSGIYMNEYASKSGWAVKFIRGYTCRNPRRKPCAGRIQIADNLEGRAPDGNAAHNHRAYSLPGEGVGRNRPDSFYMCGLLLSATALFDFRPVHGIAVSPVCNFHKRYRYRGTAADSIRNSPCTHNNSPGNKSFGGSVEEIF